MSPELEEETSHETGRYRTGLWARVRDWLETWMAVFPPEEILRDGLARRFALRCCNWLWPLEAAVRRLIIAAALALDPAERIFLSPQRRSHERDAPSPAARRLGTATFRVVSIRGAGASCNAAPGARTPAPAERHLPFPSDDLLRLGGPQRRQNRKPALSRPNPFQRHGRIRPSDPDYIAKCDIDYANSSKDLFCSPEDRRPPSRRASDPLRHFSYRAPIQSDDEEWRRIDKEWRRVLPAPGIAARIIALARVLDAPEQQIHRFARRLGVDTVLAALLRGAPPPLLRKPKYDRFGPQVDEDLTMLAHVAMQPPDTS